MDHFYYSVLGKIEQVLLQIVQNFNGFKKGYIDSVSRNYAIWIKIFTHSG